MNLSDEQLGMVEQLCYVNNKVAKAAGIEGFSGINASHTNQTVGEILSTFTDSALTKLESTNVIIGGAVASGKEWAGIIRYLKSDEAITSLQMTESYQDSDNVSLGMCFADPNEPDKAIVAFKGTTGSGEWAENAQAAAESDVQGQVDAHVFVESLPYSNITAIGHSKGGNKAMYVSMLSDKVTDCVAFDGQGFSPEFLEKYEAEIVQRSSIIRNYAVSEDFVSALLFQIPGANLHYVKGYGIVDEEGKLSGKQYHSPNSFFKTDSDGNILVGSDGQPQFTITHKAESMELLSKFTYYMLNMNTQAERRIIFEQVGDLLAATIGNGGGDPVAILLSDPDAFGLLFANLAHFIRSHNLSLADVDMLLEEFGIHVLDVATIVQVLNPHMPVIPFLATTFYTVKDLLIDLADGDNETINDLIALSASSESTLLNPLGNGLIKAQDHYEELDSRYTNRADSVATPTIQSDGTIETTGIDVGSEQCPTLHGTNIRDFRKGPGSGYQVMSTCIDTMNSIHSVDFQSLRLYSSEEWYGDLGVTSFIGFVERNESEINDINIQCKNRIETVYQAVYELDDSYQKQVAEIKEKKIRHNNMLKDRAQTAVNIY